MADPIVRTSAFAGLLDDFGAGPLIVRERRGLAILSVHARRTSSPDFAALGLPASPSDKSFVGDDDLGLLGVGPRAWLAIKADANPLWVRDATHTLGAGAAIADQSGAYGIVRVSGAAAPALLARGPFIDFDSDAFAPGCAAATLCAHIPILIWRPGRDLSYDIAVSRSYAASFADWLKRAAPHAQG